VVGCHNSYEFCERAVVWAEGASHNFAWWYNADGLVCSRESLTESMIIILFIFLDNGKILYLCRRPSSEVISVDLNRM
jgi:hypothetical protein